MGDRRGARAGLMARGVLGWSGVLETRRMLRNKSPSLSEPVLASVAELDDHRVSDVCIGLPDGPGGRFRVLRRMRATLRDAVLVAGQTASLLAGASQETLLDPQRRPSAVRISGSAESSCVYLDYDVGAVGEGRPR